MDGRRSTALYSPIASSFPSTPPAHPTASAGAYPFSVLTLDEPLSEKADDDTRRTHGRHASGASRRSRSLRRGERPPPLVLRGDSSSRPGSPAPLTHSRSSSVSSQRTPLGAHSRTVSRTSVRPPSRPPSRGLHLQGRPRPARDLLPLSAAPAAAPHKPTLAWRAVRLIKPWVPLLAYGATSLGFLIAMAFWKTQVFTGLDHLSKFLQTDGWSGYIVLYSLIFVTTIPPMPLYSTLIVLSGYTFGAIRGLIVSYCAALSGALAVFLVSRFFFRDSISRWFAQFVYLKRVVRAIEKRPKLLFLIRLAPYPYNVMNCLLAASPTLTWQTYTLCTALSLFKLIIHTSIGSTIHSFADYHLKQTGGSGAGNGTDSGAGEGAGEGAGSEEGEGSPLGKISTIVGIVLCVSIFIYLSYVARKAVDDELGEDDGLPSQDSEETLAFLSPGAADSPPMAHTPFRIPLERPRADVLAAADRPTSPAAGQDRFASAGREEASVGLY